MSISCVTTKTPQKNTSEKVATLITNNLDHGNKVLFLTSGGSNIDVTYNMFNIIKGRDLSRLSLSLIDERFVEFGDKSENWQQLLNKNTQFGNTETYRIISPNLTRLDTRKQYIKWLESKLGQSPFIICLLGIGTDGHIAGIKPNSVAVKSNQLVIDYTGPDFERITATKNLLKLSNEIIVQSSGADKKNAIQSLIKQTIDTNIQPDQMLKDFKNVTLYTDQEV
jgi:6-phosphogluconolactonase/glucosamine-6-phosphate isomerase/deaminase